MTDLVSGFLMGLVVAMPPGPMAFYMLQLAAEGRAGAIAMAAVGAALADGIWAVLAGSLVTGAGDFFHTHQAALRLLAGSVLIAFAAWNLFQKIHGVRSGRDIGAPPPRAGLPFWVGFLSTALNPVTLLTFTTWLAHAPQTRHPLLLASATLLASAGWYGLLGGMGGWLRSRLPRTSGRLELISAGAFLVSGVFLALSFLRRH